MYSIVVSYMMIKISLVYPPHEQNQADSPTSRVEPRPDRYTLSDDQISHDTGISIILPRYPESLRSPRQENSIEGSTSKYDIWSESVFEYIRDLLPPLVSLVNISIEYLLDSEKSRVTVESIE